MSKSTSSFSVKVDVTNPGQFFACCGLLELAHRLWPGAEGVFQRGSGQQIFVVGHSDAAGGKSSAVLDALGACRIKGLCEEDRRERHRLEALKRELKKKGERLSEHEEERRKLLGTMAREGALFIDSSFGLTLNWWQTADEEATTVKTWAGQQEIHKVARAAQDALRHITSLEGLFDHACVLRCPQEYRRKKSDDTQPVEPFYFDARRFAHALDAGFSLDVQGVEALAHPAVEVLSLIGVQRFRPAPTSMKWVFEYSTWSQPMPAPVAPAIVCGALPGYADHRYRFRLRFRDDQRRYKAFDFSTPMEANR